MRDHLERRPENRELPLDHAPSMPTHLPTEDSNNPRSTPLKDEQESAIDPNLPSKPDEDAAP